MNSPGVYPPVLPKDVLEDPKRRGEVDTYNALKSLETEFHVFYSCYWRDGRKFSGPTRDGEADFVVAHPALGLITLEDKGGEIL